MLDNLSTLNNGDEAKDDARGIKRVAEDNTFQKPAKRQKVAPQQAVGETMQTDMQITEPKWVSINSNAFNQEGDSKNFKEFINNLIKFESCTPTAEILKYTDKNTLSRILDYFSNNTQSNETVANYGKEISKLTPGSNLILNRGLTGLPYTIRISRSLDGIFDLSFKCLAPPLSYRDFCLALKKSENRIPSDELSQLISREHLSTIFDYFSENKKQNVTVNDFGPKIAKLAPNESLRLDKNKTGLPRTLNVLRTHQGEFMLLLETKSKLANGKKQSLDIIDGNSKSGKPAWRIDSKEVAYFNLVVPLEKDKDEDKDKNLLEIKQEVIFSQQFSSRYIDTKQLGQKFTKTKNNKTQNKVSVYSEKANCGSLRSFMKTDTYKHFYLKQKYLLLLDIFNGVKLIHEKNYVHQDLKPDNILIEGDAIRGYSAKLTDYGITTTENEPNAWGLCTLGYESPEISCAFRKPKPFDKNYTYLYEYYNNPDFETLSRQHNIKINDTAPHQYNDMWSLGIIAYEMIYGERPLLPEAQNNIDNHTLLNHLLDPDCTQRLTINKAIDILKNLISKENANTIKLT
ncbi:MAG: protein kinase [Proteobacteria bacterium]|nr:protein kinase [Pseudomonadota bacterium]